MGEEEEQEEKDFPRECLFLTGDRADCLDTRVRYMGPCNEKTLTGPACSVMKVLQSCEWIRTSFMLLSLRLSHKLPASSISTAVATAVGCGRDASQTTARGVKHLRAAAWCEFLMKQRLKVIYTHHSEVPPKRSALLRRLCSKSPPPLLLAEMDYDVCTPLELWLRSQTP